MAKKPSSENIEGILPPDEDERVFFENKDEEPVEDTEPEEEPKKAPKKVEEKEPEEAEEQEDEEGEEHEKRTVPLKKHLEERKRRQEYERKIADLERKQKLMGSRFNQVLKAMESQQTRQRAPQEQQQEEAPPDWNTAPLDHLRWNMERIQAKMQEVDQGRQQQTQMQQHHQAVQEVTSRLAVAEEEFRGQQPDYDEAVQFAMDSRHQELKALGYRDPQQRQAIIQQQALQAVYQALQNGDDPAELFYNFAKVRGFQPKAHEPEDDGYDDDGEEEAPPAAEKRPVKGKPNAVREAAKKAKAAGSSLSGRGRSDTASPSLDGLLDMEDDEFDDWFEKLWKKT